MRSEFSIPSVLHGDALVALVSQAFQLTLAEAKRPFDRNEAKYCGYSTGHVWRVATLMHGVPLEGGTLQLGTRHLTLPERLTHVEVEHGAPRGDRITATVVEMREVAPQVE